MSLKYTVKRGANLGAILIPHEHKCGRFVVSATKYKKDYRYHSTVAGAEKDLRATGDCLRMSDRNSKISKAPSLIKADLIEGL